MNESTALSQPTSSCHLIRRKLLARIPKLGRFQATGAGGKRMHDAIWRTDEAVAMLPAVGLRRFRSRMDTRRTGGVVGTAGRDPERTWLLHEVYPALCFRKQPTLRGGSSTLRSAHFFKPKTPTSLF